ncbi:MAG: hypothetical protein FWG09_02120 [Synergistaceae bacterium]|nr:hypothetical protein [Synergistaceae bacterium]
MKLIEVLAVLVIFSIFALAVISQLDAESRVYFHVIEILNKLEAQIFSIH